MTKAISGLQNLIDESSGKSQGQGNMIPNTELSKGKCLKMRCILEGVDYFIPGGQCGFLQEPPYFPFHFPLGYSIVGSPAKPDAIIKHAEKKFMQTGISTEVVDLPLWWEKRDL